MRVPVTGSVLRVSRSATVAIAVVAAGAAVYWLADILTPLAMAIFLLIMIGGIQREIEHRTPLGQKGSGLVALLLVVLGFFASIWIIVDGAAGFFSEASGVSARIGPRLDQIIADVSAMAGVQDPPTTMDLINQIDLRGYLTQLAFQVQGIASGAFFVLVYLGFLLASRAGFKRKMVNMFPDRESRHDAVEVMDRVRSGVEGYLWVQAVTGVMICAVAWLLMRWVGLQNAEFWTFVIFVVGFIPVLGGAIAGLAPPLFALVQFDTYWQPLVLLGGLQLILFVVGNWIQPRMQGDNQNIDPVLVLLSLAFWGKLWGVAGMFLSTPLAVMAMAILAEFKGSRWIAVLFSGNGDPYGAPKSADKPARPSLRDKLTRLIRRGK